jgi:hypothetical protein
VIVIVVVIAGFRFFFDYVYDHDNDNRFADHGMHPLQDLSDGLIVIGLALISDCQPTTCPYGKIVANSFISFFPWIDNDMLNLEFYPAIPIAAGITVRITPVAAPFLTRTYDSRVSFSEFVSRCLLHPDVYG